MNSTRVNRYLFTLVVLGTEKILKLAYSYEQNIKNVLKKIQELYKAGVGVQETSYYPAIIELFNTAGDELKPKVKAISHPKSSGAGIPDIGLFTAEQIDNKKNNNFDQQLLPERGVVEVKGFSEELTTISSSDQVKKYLQTYHFVIISNLKSFQALKLKDNGNFEDLGKFIIFDNVEELRIKSIEKIIKEKEGFEAFIKRILLTTAPLKKPQDLAWCLAVYAKEAKARLINAKQEHLSQIRIVLENFLGIKFENKSDLYFFESTLIQTLFYIIFCAWVISYKQNANNDIFDWRLAPWLFSVPVINDLFNSIATNNNLKSLDLKEILERASDELNRVDKHSFFDRLEADDAIQYFYEPFLEAFDPELRKDLGVWYTPSEVVTYMVERTDRMLKTELGIKRGLADPSVTILDPACGTGAFLIAVLKRIRKTIEEEGGDVLAMKDDPS